MPLRLQLFIICVGILIMAGLFHYLITQSISERDSIIWFIIVGIGVVFTLFPSLLNYLSWMLGIDYPPTLLFLVVSLLLIAIVFRNSLDISRLKDENRELISQISLLKSQIDSPETENSQDISQESKEPCSDDQIVRT